jgi:hypothetical protein
MTREEKIAAGVAVGLFTIPILAKYLSPKFQSDYYTIRDVQNSPTANANQIYNVAPASVIRNAQRFHDTFLVPLINYLGWRPAIGSWYRSQALNNHLYEVEEDEPDKYSEHVEGYTADLDDPTRNGDIVRAIIELDLPFNQLILEKGTLQNPKWVHVSSKPTGNARQILFYNGSEYEELTLNELINALY